MAEEERVNDSGSGSASWSHVSEIPRVCLDGRNWPKSVGACVVVGTLLFLINQSQVVFSGQATVATWVRIGLSYLVPFVVANYGIVTASRRPG